MFGRLQLLQDSFYSPFGADEVGGPLGPHVFFPVRAFLGPNLIGLDDFVIRVAQQWKGKTMFFNEFLVTFNAIAADAEKLDFRLEFTPGIAQLTGLGGAPWGTGPSDKNTEPALNRQNRQALPPGRHRKCRRLRFL